MRTVVVNTNATNITSEVFASSLVNRLREFTSEEVFLKVNNNRPINARSIRDVKSINLNALNTLEITVSGECENYAIFKIERIVKQLLN